MTAMNQTLHRAGLALLPLLLCACAASTPPPTATSSARSVSRAETLSQDYHALAGDHPGRVFALDAGASQVRIYVFRGGAAARAGHDHVISVPKFTGYAYVPDKGYADARFDLEFRLADLDVDPPELRKATGGTFAPILSQDDRDGTRDHLLSTKGFDAAKYPFVEIHSVSVTGDPPEAVARIAVTLHGVTRDQDVPLHVTLADGQLEVHGEFALRQTDFGVTPYSVLGGLLAVKDPVSIRFDLKGRTLPAH